MESPLCGPFLCSKMEVLFILIGASTFIALVFLCAFFWANTDGQYDDDETPAIRMLFDDELASHEPKEND